MVPQGTWLRESYMLAGWFFKASPFWEQRLDHHWNVRSTETGKQNRTQVLPTLTLTTTTQKSAGYQSHQQPIITITHQQPGCRSGSWNAPWMHKSLITTTSICLALIFRVESRLFADILGPQCESREFYETFGDF